jgi:DNA (cytosine-5)-methyltransferase 1
MRARSGPTLIDLFCGAGGFTLGFVQCGFRPVFAVDSDQDCVSTYASNFGAHAVTARMERVRQFPAADVVIGGPPCQGLSNLGSHVPNDPRNQLWREFVRCVAAIRPVVFVLENVPPLLASGEYACLRRIAQGSVCSVCPGAARCHGRVQAHDDDLPVPVRAISGRGA